MTVSHNFLVFLWLWQFWRDLAMYLVECPSVGICLMFFSWSDWSYHFGEEGHRGKVLFSTRHIKRAWYQHNTSLLTLTLATCWDSDGQVSVLWNSFSFLFLKSTPWMEVTLHSPHSRSEELHFISERRVSSGIIWHSAKICPFSHIYLFIQTLIHIGMKSWIFIFIIIFLLWAINQYHFIFLNYSSFAHWELFHFNLVWFGHSHITLQIQRFPARTSYTKGNAWRCGWTIFCWFLRNIQRAECSITQKAFWTDSAFNSETAPVFSAEAKTEIWVSRKDPLWDILSNRVNLCRIHRRPTRFW